MISVILAGGSGTRFWPVSTKERPKQLVELWGGRVMIGHTIDRLRRTSDLDESFIVCGEHLVAPMREALPEVDASNFIVEPMARNTAPAIALAAAHIAERFGEDVTFGVYPSDHYVGDPAVFDEAVALGHERAATGAIVTLGITPSRPETGYGYIHRTDDARDGAYAVEAFVEKPDHATALDYLASGDYLWNAGMFFMTPGTLFEELARQLPTMHEAMTGLRGVLDDEDADHHVHAAFERIEGVSIDYGVMEGAQQVEVIPAKFAWSDVGHWAALPEVAPVDEAGNVTEADTILHDVTDSILYSSNRDRILAGVGLDGMIVVDTDDAVLVMPKSRSQDVRAIVAALKERAQD